MSVSESETNAIDEDVKFENPQLETESLTLDFRLEYTWKSSLRDSISMSMLDGNSATSDMVEAYKPSLKDSILKPKIESLRLEML